MGFSLPHLNITPIEDIRIEGGDKIILGTYENVNQFIILFFLNLFIISYILLQLANICL